MKIQTLRKKAQSGTLEVEDILKAAIERPPGLSDELRRLSTELGWSSTGKLPNGELVVPLAQWAEVVAVYAAGGFDSLSDFAKKSANDAFVLRLLVELKTADALCFLLCSYAHCIESPGQATGAAIRIASTLNFMLSFKSASPITSSQAHIIQTFLLRLFSFTKSDVNRATVLLALRGVGDARAMEFILSVPDLKYPWAEVKPRCLRAIRKRLKKNPL